MSVLLAPPFSTIAPYRPGRPLPQDVDLKAVHDCKKPRTWKGRAEKLGFQKIRQDHPSSLFSINVAAAKAMTKNPTRKSRSGTKICDTPAPFSITARRASLE